jgi:hypothetical protein
MAASIAVIWGTAIDTSTNPLLGRLEFVSIPVNG